MDVLSDVVTTMKAGRPKITRSRRTGRWGSRFGPYPGAGFHLVLRGACWLLPPRGAPVRLTAGDIVLLPHGAVHGMSDSADHRVDQLPLDTTAAGTSSTVTGVDIGIGVGVGVGVEPAGADDEGDHTLLLCGAYRLDRGVVHPFLRGLPDVLHLPARLGRHASLRSTIDLIATDLTEGRPGADVALPALLDLLLVYALRAWLEDQCPQEAGGWCAALKDPAVAAALDRMHRDPAHPWTVRELADAVGLSRTTFAARFTAYVGRPPMAYLTWWRLCTAARMLRDSSAPLAGIARQVGYGSEFAFAHAFKREFGTAPGGFRRSRTAPDVSARPGGAQG
ncbi:MULTISPECIES: AraC family transcriptional regulator [Streptomyces]|uniref:AraC family transcriptional regulator n=1 Tax=Streptomyces TaxID=1883 RepID=UPI0007CD5565|nr:AraC family transcriptional regulator [Streptomyces noursei]